MKKKYLVFIVLVIMIFLSGCKNTVSNKEPAEEGGHPGLYPAYVYDKNNKNWGYISKTGEFIISPQYGEANDFNNQGYAIVNENGLYGVINLNGEYVVKPEYQYILAVEKDGIVAASSGENRGYSFIDLEGNIIKQVYGSIGEFSEGLALYSESVDRETYRYGYIDTRGNVVIEPKYMGGSKFKDGVALVKVREKSFAVIDVNEKVINMLNENIISDISEGVVIYRNDNTTKEGYMTIEGKKITEAEYEEASPFINGLAEVMISDGKDSYLRGLINKDAKYVVEPKYGGVQVIGQGLYAVSKPTDYLWRMWDEYIPKAVMDQNGKLLTEFNYYQLAKVDNTMNYISDALYTYITDNRYMKLDKFPKLNGFGTIKSFNDILKVELDKELIYITTEGEEIWRSDYTYNLKNGETVVKNKYKPNRFMLTYYPQIIGHKNRKTEKELNNALDKIFVYKQQNEEELYYEIIEKDFEVREIGSLTTIVENGYFYSIGGAHGMPWKRGYHIDITTGRFYSLRDLFVDNSNFNNRLETIVKEQMKAKSESDIIYYDDAEPRITEDQFVLFTEEGIEIYYQVYEIASYAVGMPSFIIPYEEISDIINTEDELWKLITQ